MSFALVFQAIEAVLSFSLLGVVGYVLSYKGWVKGESQILLARLVTIVALPPYLFSNVVTSFTHDQFMHIIYGSLLPLVSVLITFAVSVLVAKLLRVIPARRGLFYSGFTFSNTIFIGLPVNLALFGESSLPYALLYYFASTICFWTLGNYYISCTGEGKKEKIISKRTCKRIFSPPFIGFLLGIIIVLLGIPVPSFLLATAKYLGGMTTPLIIIIAGVALQELGLRNIKLTRDLVGVLAGRFIIAPAITLGVCWFMPLPALMRQVFLIQASLPVLSTLALLASHYELDREYAASILSASILCSIVTIPLFMYIGLHIT